MANKGYSYGLSRQCEVKTMKKFDVSLAREALWWIEAVLEEALSPASDEINDQVDVRNALQDGQALCRLMNCLQPGAIKKIHTSHIAFKEMENIEKFLKACREYGMTEVDTFQTQDLYECKAMYSAQKNGYMGPTIGVKLAQENKREFTPEQVARGKTIVSLQYGSTLGASQKGMTAYGSTRKM